MNTWAEKLLGGDLLLSFDEVLPFVGCQDRGDGFPMPVQMSFFRRWLSLLSSPLRGNAVMAGR